MLSDYSDIALLQKLSKVLEAQVHAARVKCFIRNNMALESKDLVYITHQACT